MPWEMVKPHPKQRERQEGNEVKPAEHLHTYMSNNDLN